MPADDDTIMVRVFPERTVIPEGAAASVFVDADTDRDLTFNLAASGLTGAQANVIFSPSSLTLSVDEPSASFSISVEDNEEPQGNDRTFNVDLNTELIPQSELPNLTITIPPNDLSAYAVMPAEFKIEETESTITINTMPPLRGDKSFLVFSEDPRLIVKTGFIAPGRSPFPIELALSEGVGLGREERLDLSIIHLDSWRQRSAQAQLSAGGSHSCGIKADRRMACWGNSDSGQTDLTRSQQDVDTNTRFLSVSASSIHSCGIKADGAAVCWGGSGGRTIPTRSPQGVDANTRFLAVSAGGDPSLGHSCGIKADSTVACWGSSSDDRTDPTSAAGVNADTRFLAVSVGHGHTCGIKADSTAACWGVGGNNRSNPLSSPQGVDANTRFIALSAGAEHTCGIKANSAVACWGNSGDGRTDPTSGPQDVDADTRFFALSAGGSHNCGIKGGNTVACWGNSGSDRTDQASAEGVDANTRFLAVSAGGSHSCGIKTDGAAACWGNNGNNRTNPPPDSFNQTRDALMLAERATPLTTEDGGKPAQLNEVTEVEPLHSQLTIGEGETTTLTLFRVLSGPANPITITLTIEESDKRFLSFISTQPVISEAGGEATASITAIDNDVAASIDPVSISLSLTGDNARLTPH